jgi:hypothetical protein
MASDTFLIHVQIAQDFERPVTVIVNVMTPMQFACDSQPHPPPLSASGPPLRLGIMAIHNSPPALDALKDARAALADTVAFDPSLYISCTLDEDHARGARALIITPLRIPRTFDPSNLLTPEPKLLYEYASGAPGPALHHYLGYDTTTRENDFRVHTCTYGPALDVHIVTNPRRLAYSLHKPVKCALA